MASFVGRFLFTNADGEQVWEADCSECGENLGTMTLITILRAISDRGDLRCPSCRKKTCDMCDTTFDLRLGRLEIIDGYRVCWFCMQEILAGSLVLFPKSQTGGESDEG